MKLYISFGSNLCRKQMWSRCPGARPLGKFMLTSARLVFRGAADVDYMKDSIMPCGLWAITKSDEDALDRYEGVAGGLYMKSEDIVLKYKGEPQKALIYLMTSEGVYPPSQAYANIIRQGYRDFKLDESFLDAAIARSFEDKNHDEQTRARRMRQRESALHRNLVQMPEAVAAKLKQG